MTDRDNIPDFPLLVSSFHALSPCHCVRATVRDPSWQVNQLAPNVCDLVRVADKFQQLVTIAVMEFLVAHCQPQAACNAQIRMLGVKSRQFPSGKRTNGAQVKAMRSTPMPVPIDEDPLHHISADSQNEVDK